MIPNKETSLKITIPKAPIKNKNIGKQIAKINVKGKRYTRYINKFVK